MVIFGASGDLTRRKLVPALINLRRGGLLPDAFAIVAVVRTARRRRGFRDELLDGARRVRRAAARSRRSATGSRRAFASCAATSRMPTCTPAVGAARRARRRAARRGNALFYLAVPPELLRRPSSRGLGARRPRSRGANGGWRRVIVEKPFGHDLDVGARAQPSDRRRSSTSGRSTASITTSGRRPSRT